MQDFFSINLGHLLTIAAFLVGGVAFAYTIKGDVGRLGDRMKPVEDELIRLREVVVALARQEERINAMDARMLAQGKRFDEISAIVMRGTGNAREGRS